MNGKTVFEIFKSYFPKLTDEVEIWFINGKNSIRVKMINLQELIFTYNSKYDWRLETIDSYIKRTKGGSNM